jgi:uncharacterized protein (UPF0335 family)
MGNISKYYGMSITNVIGHLEAVELENQELRDKITDLYAQIAQQGGIIKSLKEESQLSKLSERISDLKTITERLEKLVKK